MRLSLFSLKIVVGLKPWLTVGEPKERVTSQDCAPQRVFLTSGKLIDSLPTLPRKLGKGGPTE